MHFAFLGAAPCIVGSLLIEAYFVGWKHSALYQVLVEDTPSNRSDIVYFTLYCANMLPVLGFICSLGLGYYISALIHQLF